MSDIRDDRLPDNDSGMEEVLPEEKEAASAEENAAGIQPEETVKDEVPPEEEEISGGDPAPSGEGEEKDRIVPLMPEWFPRHEKASDTPHLTELSEEEKRGPLHLNWWTPGRVIGATVLASVLLASAAGIATYHRHAVYYSTHFFEGTKINGIDASGMTVAEVEDLIREEAEAYSLELTFREGRKEVLTAGDIGCEYVSDGTVLALMGTQNGMNWYFANREEKEDVAVEKTTVYSEEAVKKALDDLYEFQPAGMTAPKDAELFWDGEKYIVAEEEQGTTLDPVPVYDAVCRAVDEGENSLDVTALEGAYASPSVYSTDEGLNREASQLNELLTSHVTYELPTGTKTLDGGTMRDWLVRDEDGNYVRDEDHWQEMTDAFIEELAEEVNTLDKDRTFTSTESGTVSIIGSDYYGWEIDIWAEQYQLPMDLESEEPVEREPFYTSRELAKADDHDGIGPDYVEADLTRQHLWVYHDGEMVYESDLVSGNMTDAKYTPEGVYPLISKQEHALLVGASYGEGVYEYVAQVNYWMPFTYTGIGLHDATWRDAFGGDIYQTDGSHGCLNLPLETAEAVYGYVEPGTPIVVYYSEGNPLETRMTDAEEAEKAEEEKISHEAGETYEYIFEGTEEEFYQEYGDGSYGEAYEDSHSETAADYGY